MNLNEHLLKIESTFVQEYYGIELGKVGQKTKVDQVSTQDGVEAAIGGSEPIVAAIDGLLETCRQKGQPAIWFKLVSLENMSWEVAGVGYLYAESAWVRLIAALLEENVPYWDSDIQLGIFVPKSTGAVRLDYARSAGVLTVDGFWGKG